jgi:hypothetical protein
LDKNRTRFCVVIGLNFCDLRCNKRAGLAPVDWLSPLPPPQAETIKNVKKLAKLPKPNLEEPATCFKSKNIKKPLVQIKSGL